MPPPLRTTDADYHFHCYDYVGSAPWTLSLPQASRNNLRFYSMAQDLQGLLATGLANGVPNIALTNLGAAITDDGRNRNITALSFGGPAPLGGTPEVLITGGIHAREWVAPEMAYLLAEYLIRNYPPAAVGLNVYQQWIRNVVNQRRIHIIPMLNPAGCDYSVFSLTPGTRLWRRNRRPMPATAPNWLAALTNPVTGVAWLPFQNAATAGGVTSYDVPRYAPPPVVFDTTALPNKATQGADLNRNFATVAYGHNCPPNLTNSVPATDGYFGTRGASELETRNIQAFLATCNNLETSIDYHSYSQLILFPSELFNSGAVNGNFSRLGQILQRLIATSTGWTWGYNYQLGSPMQLLHYDATGSLADYIGQQRNSRSFVIELDPADRSGGGFRLPENRIRTVFEKNIRGALALIVAAGQASTFATTTYCCFTRRTISSAERGLLTWNVYGRGNRLPR